MRSGSYIFCLGVMLFFAQITFSQGPSARRYSFKSMIVDYRTNSKGLVGGVDTLVSNGTKSLWIDNYGKLEAEQIEDRVVTQKMGVPMTQDVSTLSLVDGKSIYSIDLITKSGTKLDLGGHLAKQRIGKDLTLYTKAFLEKNGGKWLGVGKFLGRNCEIFEFGGLKQWNYKGVLLKGEGTIEGVYSVVEAISVKEEVEIPAMRFKVPKDITISEIPSGITGSDDGYTVDVIEQKSTITLPFERFKQVVADVYEEGYPLISTLEQGGEYLSVSMKSERDVIMIQVTSIDDVDMVTGEDATVLRQFIINGHSAKVVHIKDSEEGKAGVKTTVFISYPELGLNLLVSGSELVADSILEHVAQQVKF